MKAISLLAISAIFIASSNAMPSYLSTFPNGDLFSKDAGGNGQKLGHRVPSTDNSEFGLLFSANRKWSTLCKLTYPGTQMTVGAAFGDPCCEWSSGPAPQKITPWADKPTATVCKSSAPAPAPAPATPSVPATPTTPTAPTPATPSVPATPTTPTAPTPAPAPATPSVPATPTTAPNVNSTVANPPTTAVKPGAGGCKVKSQ